MIYTIITVPTLDKTLPFDNIAAAPINTFVTSFRNKNEKNDFGNNTFIYINKIIIPA